MFAARENLARENLAVPEGDRSVRSQESSEAPAGSVSAGASGSDSAGASGSDSAGVPIAFFDLDGTLVAGQTQRLLVGFLRKEGMVSRRFVLGTAVWFAGYRLGLVEAGEQARARGAELLAGLPEEQVADLMSRFREQVLAPRLFAPAVAALCGHRERGDRVIILSAAFEPLVAALARRLGVDEFFATRLERAHGTYTGRVEGKALYGEEKAAAARVALAAAGVDAGLCWAYADHETDVGLLRMVGNPVAVRPKPGLKRVAESEGWPIIG
ncbi:MAG: HAD family hydrolase [Thermoleophilia bacterium]